MKTKEKIADEALSLFSVRGYKGTSVKAIADAVGIKDSSLYKHFKSKQEILDTIVATMGKRIEIMSEELGLPRGEDLEAAARVYQGFDEEKLVSFSRSVFLFYWKDSFVSRFWRMGTIEQFHNAEVYALFSKLFLEDSISYQSTLFEELMRKGIFVNGDPEVMAINFYAPIFFLLSKYANATEEEQTVLQMLDKQVREFYRVYHKR